MVNSGLTISDIATITKIFEKYPEVISVVLFGSRAKGTYKPASDIDLAIMNIGVPTAIIAKIKGELEETNLAYFVDLIDYTSLAHEELKEHIDRVGVPFYQIKK